MADADAKHFLLLSRSGPKTTEAKELLAEMADRGVEIKAPSCDVTSKDSLSACLSAHSSMPPIKGCIVASMVLRDALFTSMTHEDWDTSIKPKVQGSWNLHELLPADLDHFVMLSSLASATGSRGQANYSAGNAFQDALARHRQSLGRKGVALNFGPILSIGVAAEHNLEDLLAAQGFEGIRIQDVLALIEYATDPNLPIPANPSDRHVITGLGGARKLGPEQGSNIYWMQRRLFSPLRNAKELSENGGEGDAAAQTVSTGQLLSQTKEEGEQKDVIVSSLIQKLSKAVNIPAEDVEPSKPIHAFGIDSLVALEIRYWFMKEVKANLPVFDIMGAPSLSALAEIARSKSEYCAKKN